MLKPEVFNEHAPETVLIKTENNAPETVKEGFRIAAHLRDAGYAVETDLGGQPSVVLRWMLEVRTGKPRFVITDTVNRKEDKAQTSKEVLGLLEGKGDD